MLWLVLLALLSSFCYGQSVSDSEKSETELLNELWQNLTRREELLQIQEQHLQQRDDALTESYNRLQMREQALAERSSFVNETLNSLQSLDESLSETEKSLKSWHDAVRRDILVRDTAIVIAVIVAVWGWLR